MNRDNSAILRFGAFAVVSALVCAYLGVVLGHVYLGSTATYHALFKDASGLKAGAPVRIAGVEVGRVSGLSINDGGEGDGAVKVDFAVNSDIHLTSDVEVVVRYKNLVGDQYLQLDQAGTDGQPLPPGATIPQSHTRGSLDLDALFNGFQPLFAGLDTAQINQVSAAVVNILEGQQSGVYQLVSTISDLFGTLADNDDLINQVITNLDVALGSLAKRSTTIGGIVDELERMIAGFAHDRRPIAASLSQINGLAVSAAALLRKVRPSLRTDVPAIDAIAKSINARSDSITAMLNELPSAYDKLIRAGSYGSFFNFYLCGIRLKLTGADGKPVYTPWTVGSLARCERP